MPATAVHLYFHMHDDAGVAIAEDSLMGYMNTLVQLVQGINNDLADR